jgi:hypothetical protein
MLWTTTIAAALPLRTVSSQQPVDETSIPDGNDTPGQWSDAGGNRCGSIAAGASSREASTTSDPPAVCAGTFHRIFVLPLSGVCLFG